MRSIGIDSVEIERFKHWHTYSIRQLEKIFSRHEIDYCLANPRQSSERFAVRFAAKEATYKALCSLNIIEHSKHSFLSSARAFEVHKQAHVPRMVINWNMLTRKSLTNTITLQCSLTHTKTTATAIIIVI